MMQSDFAERNLQRLFPLPAVIFVAMLMVFPVIYTSYLSFTNWNLTSGMPATFVGLSSYERVLTEPRFLSALGRTFAFTFFAVGDRGRAGCGHRADLQSRLRRQEPGEAAAAAAARGDTGCHRDRLQSLLRSDHRPRQLRPAVVRIADRAVDLEREVRHSVVGPRRRVAVDADDHAHRPGGPRRPVARSRSRPRASTARASGRSSGGSRSPWSCRSF